MRRAFAFAAAALALSATRVASAYCPCYSPSSAHNTHNCGVDPANGKNPTNAEWNMIFDLVSGGEKAWGNQGPSIGQIGQGCGKPEKTHDVDARFPCELLKGIAKQESGWRQFCVPDTPADEVGGASRTIISFDCGYGVGQVTSGMHKGESPAFDRARVAAEPTYNLATGTQILAGKWKATNCVGDNQPAIVEDWYTATWAYNGLAYVNNPNNPNYDSGRGVWDPNVGGAAPYQEKIFGWMENNGGSWPAVALAYPDPGTTGMSGSPGDLDEPSCASPTDCKNKRSVHPTACGGSSTTSSSGGGAGGTGGSGVTVGTGGASSIASATSASSSGSGPTSGTGLGNGMGVNEGGDVSGKCSCEVVGGTGTREAAAPFALVLAAWLTSRARRGRRRRR